MLACDKEEMALKRKIPFILVILIVILFSTIRAWAVDLTVRVTDCDKKNPIPGALFEFYSLSENGRIKHHPQERTDESGIITLVFDTLMNQVIHWRCRHPDYRFKEFGVYNLSKPAGNTLDICLVKKKLTIEQEPDIIIQPPPILTRPPQIVIKPTQVEIVIDTVRLAETKIKEGKSTLEILGTFALVAAAYWVYSEKIIKK